MSNLIYIADDEEHIRNLICSFLENKGFQTQSFDNGDSLLESFLMRPADMIILDIMMPGTDGLTICSKIRESHNVPIIIVSARDSEQDRIAGITLGGDDYLSKPFSPLELVARVEAIFRRIHLDKNITHSKKLAFGNLSIDIENKRAKINNEPVELTPTELALMTYFIINKERAISREELLKNVWKFDFEVDTRATDDVVKRLRKKLLSSNVKITAVWGFGFKIELIE